MFDVGWQELMVIGVLALLVVGPKELPTLLRTVGQWVGRARGVAREFQRSMDEAARQADVKEFRDLAKDVRGIGKISYDEQAKRTQSMLDASRKPAAQAGTQPNPQPNPQPGAQPNGAGQSAAAPSGPSAEAPAMPQPIVVKPAAAGAGAAGVIAAAAVVVEPGDPDAS